MNKPIVQYVDASPPELFARAHIYLKGRGWVVTSPVQRIERKPNGPVIETLNTIYVPPTTDESLPSVSSRGIAA